MFNKIVWLSGLFFQHSEIRFCIKSLFKPKHLCHLDGHFFVCGTVDGLFEAQEVKMERQKECGSEEVHVDNQHDDQEHKKPRRKDTPVLYSPPLIPGQCPLPSFTCT